MTNSIQMKTSSKISSLIGQTPLVRINSLSELTGNHIYAKCEHLNPGGSIKDRTALGLIQNAIKKGLLKANTEVFEGTAGNTGIGLALLAHEFKYKCTLVMPNNQSAEKYHILKAFGANVITVDPCPFTNEKHFYHQARIKASETANSFWVNQFENTANFDIHFSTTGPEIWRQTGGQIDAFISAVGSGGTIGGVSNYLKLQNPDIHIRLADPMGSGLYSYFNTQVFKSEGSSITEGIGIMRLTENFKKAKVDSATQINDDQMMSMLNHVAKYDGFIVGTSAALNLAASYEYALENKNKNINIVTVICDSGLRYADKIFNEAFIESKGITLSNII